MSLLLHTHTDDQQYGAIPDSGTRFTNQRWTIFAVGPRDFGGITVCIRDEATEDGGPRKGRRQVVGPSTLLHILWTINAEHLRVGNWLRVAGLVKVRSLKSQSLYFYSNFLLGKFNGK